MANWKICSLSDSSPAATDAYKSIVGESLQYFDDEVWETYIRRLGAENIRCIWQNDAFVGGMAFYRTGQWYGGKIIPCAAISGVGIDPAVRGSGACRHLLQNTLRELHAEGMPLASLYASTQQLYRRVGFEHSGLHYDYSIPMASLALMSNSPLLPVTRHEKPPIDQLAAMTDIRNRRSNGNLQRTSGMWERIFQPITGTTSTYIIGPEKLPEGFITLQHGSRSAGHPQPLVATEWVANTPAAFNRLICLIRAHRSMCDSFRWSGGPQDPLLLAAAEERVQVQLQLHTLNRILRIKDAFERRGYGKFAHGKLELCIHDALLDDNAGNWTLEVDSGCGQCTRGGRGILQMNIAAAVPLFCGLHNCSQLVAMGYIHCRDQDQIDLADQVFTGPAPWTSEIF